jgi:hypothetical protein
MALPAKPKGGLQINTNSVFADAYIYPMSATAKTAALGKADSEAYTQARGAVALVDDAYGVGLRKPGGGTDDYIQLAFNNTPGQAASIPFTRVFVVRPETTNAVLFHAAIRNSSDYSYSTGAQLFRFSGGYSQFLSSNVKQIASFDSSAQVTANKVVCVAIAWDGVKCTVAVDGTIVGTVDNATSFSLLGEVGLGSGANGDTTDAMTFYWYESFTRALSSADLVSITNNPYQNVLLESQPVPGDTTPPVASSASSNAGGDVVTITMNEDLAGTAPAGSTFTINGKTVANVALSGKSVILSGISPAIANGEILTVSYTKPATNGLRDASSNQTANFGPLSIANNVPVPLPGTGKPVVPGHVVVVFGDSAGDDFSTEAALNNYVNNLNCVDLNKSVMVYLRKNLNLTDRQFGPTLSDDTRFVKFRPYPGVGYSELEADTAAGQYGNQGVELLLNNPGGFRAGCDVAGFRVNISASANSPYQILYFRRDGWGQGGNVAKFHHNRVMCNSTSKIGGSGEYAIAGVVEDNLFIVNADNTKPIWSSSSGGQFNRNTVVRLNGAVGVTAIEGFSGAYDNVYAGCGGNPQGGVAGSNNYTDTALSVASTTTTYVAGGVFQSWANYRPRAGTAIIGGATEGAKSKNDNNDNNRGLTPDAGAFQLTPAIALPQGQITLQQMDGQTLKLSISTVGTVASALVTLTPANPGNGASGVGPVAMTLGTNSATLEIDDVSAGNYLAPTITLSNAGGATLVIGTTAFDVAGLGSLVYDAAPTGPATAVVVSQPAGTIVNIASGDFAVGLNGTSSATVRVTPSDNGGGGTFTPTFVDIVNGAPAKFTYKRGIAGTVSITLTNNGSLTNPSAVSYVVANPPVGVEPPVIQLQTTDSTLLKGKKAIAAGIVDFKGDVNGKVEIFFDKSDGVTVLGPYAGIVANGTWTVNQELPPGIYVARSKVTANGLSATDASGTVTMRGMTGKVQLGK